MASLTWHRLTPRHYRAEHPTLGVINLWGVGPSDSWVLYWQDPARPHTIAGRQRTPTGKGDLRAAKAAAERTLRQIVGSNRP